MTINKSYLGLIHSKNPQHSISMIETDFSISAYVNSSPLKIIILFLSVLLLSIIAEKIRICKLIFPIERNFGTICKKIHSIIVQLHNNFLYL